MVPLSLLLLLLLAPLALASPTPTDLGLSSALDLVELTAPEFKKDFTNRVLLIRHGEKPSNQDPGLSLAGKKRAQCLRTVRQVLLSPANAGDGGF